MKAESNPAGLRRNCQIRILIVDDDQTVRDALRDALKAADYSVSTAEDGKDGIDRLRTERFDLMVLDLNLPVLSGWDVLDLVKSESPTLPVIILSGELRQCEPGAFERTDVVLEKPCEPDVLLKTIAELMAGGSRRPEEAGAGVRTGPAAVPGTGLRWNREKNPGGN